MPVVFTVVSRNHLYRARVLMEDVRRHLPAARQIVCLTDDAAGLFDPAHEPFELLPLRDYAPPDCRHLAFALPVYAFCCALKAHATRYLLEHTGGEPLIYLDSDTRLYAPPVELLEAVARHDLVLTPHVLFPEKNSPANMDVTLSGAFNAGLFAVAPSAEALRLVGWWAAQMSSPERVSERFVFDQVWLSLMPAFSAGAHVLRHPGYNVAYWNLHERPLQAAGPEWRVAGVPLVVFHFSGLQLDRPEELAATQAPFFPLPDARWRHLGVDYAAALEAAGRSACEAWGYEFDRFRDGKALRPSHRRYFLQALWGRLDPGADPFDPTLGMPKTGLRSLYHADHPITRVYRWVRFLPSKLVQALR